MQINTPMKIKRDRGIKRQIGRSERKGLKIGSKIQIGRDICKDMYLERGKYRNLEKNKQTGRVIEIESKWQKYGNILVEMQNKPQIQREIE